MASIVVLLAGIGLATVTDSQVSSNLLGMAVAAVNIFVTALYQVSSPMREPLSPVWNAVGVW